MLLPKPAPTVTGHCRYDHNPPPVRPGPLVQQLAVLHRHGFLRYAAGLESGLAEETARRFPSPGLARYGSQHRSSHAPERGADHPRQQPDHRRQE